MIILKIFHLDELAIPLFKTCRTIIETGYTSRNNIDGTYFLAQSISENFKFIKTGMLLLNL